MSILTGLILVIDLQSNIISILKVESRHMLTDNKSRKRNANAMANEKGPNDTKQFENTAKKSVVEFYLQNAENVLYFPSG